MPDENKQIVIKQITYDEQIIKIPQSKQYYFDLNE